MALQFTGILWVDILILILIIAGILVIYKFIIYLIKRAVRIGRIPPDVVNGLKLFIRLIFVIIIIILIITYTELPPEVTLALSAIVGTVIGFASIQGIQNFISGIYIILTHPFGINQLIAIGDWEGIVTEISLNYTKLSSPSGRRVLISNRNILNSNIVNFTQTSKIKPEEEKLGLTTVKHILIEKHLTRYAFSLELPLTNPKKLMKDLEETATAWELEFGYKPEYTLWALGQFATFRFILTAKKPESILKNKPLFIKEIYRRAYSKD